MEANEIKEKIERLEEKEKQIGRNKEVLKAAEKALEDIEKMVQETESDEVVKRKVGRPKKVITHIKRVKKKTTRSYIKSGKYKKINTDKRTRPMSEAHKLKIGKALKKSHKKKGKNMWTKEMEECLINNGIKATMMEYKVKKRQCYDKMYDMRRVKR